MEMAAHGVTTVDLELARRGREKLFLQQGHILACDSLLLVSNPVKLDLGLRKERRIAQMQRENWAMKISAPANFDKEREDYMQRVTTRKRVNAFKEWPGWRRGEKSGAEKI